MLLSSFSLVQCTSVLFEHSCVKYAQGQTFAQAMKTLPFTMPLIKDVSLNVGENHAQMTHRIHRI
jgi:hypothetical protein